MGTIAVVDYGMGNLRSVANALESVAPQARVVIAERAQQVRDAERVVFPGQGAIPDCIRFLEQAGLREAVVEAARSKPLFGVCVGEQMLFDWSAEGDQAALGVLPGRVLRFPDERMRTPEGQRLKVPHIGWNRVAQTRAHPVWRGVPDGAHFYFVHSYFVVPADDALTVGTSDYGLRFTCAVAKDNIFATQFHPEKSADHGLQLYRNFIDWQP